MTSKNCDRTKPVVSHNYRIGPLLIYNTGQLHVAPRGRCFRMQLLTILKSILLCFIRVLFLIVFYLCCKITFSFSTLMLTDLWFSCNNFNEINGFTDNSVLTNYFPVTFLDRPLNMSKVKLGQS